MIYKNPDWQKQKMIQKTFAKILKNNHQFCEGIYENRQSRLVIYCWKHDTKHETTFYNYLRSQTGMPCCGNQRKMSRLKNRIFSIQTIDKMKQAARNRPLRGGKPRKWRKNKNYQLWREKVFQKWNNKCAITGQTKEGANLVCHHLISAHLDQKLCYIPSNGILITKKLHKLFHDTYGYTKNDISQFRSFLFDLLTNENLRLINLSSSQASKELLEGSETKAHNPERIMKLHERLGKLKL